MIKMKALRSFHGDGEGEGRVKRGREFTARGEQRARELESHGLAYRIEAKAMPTHLNKNLPGTEVNKAVDAGPLDSAGGKTGAAAPAPSSQAAPQRRRRRSGSSAADLLS